MIFHVFISMEKTIQISSELIGANYCIETNTEFLVSPAVYFLLYDDPSIQDIILSQLKVIKLEKLIEDELMMITKQRKMKDISVGKKK